MKRLVYFIIVVMSFTLIFPQGSSCCKNNACKGKVSCKFNQATLDTDKDAAVELTAETTDRGNQSLKCKATDGSKCAKSCTNIPWWKFWAKKKNCCNANTKS